MSPQEFENMKKKYSVEESRRIAFSHFSIFVARPILFIVKTIVAALIFKWILF